MSSRVSTPLSSPPATSIIDGNTASSPTTPTPLVVTHIRPRRRRRTSTPPKTPAPRPLRKAHETVIETCEVEDGFVPLDVPERPLVAHLPDDVSIDDPASFFCMFFGEEQFEGFARCTNKYAVHWRTEQGTTKRHAFKPVSAQEMKVYVALLTFIDYQGNGRPKSHWENPTPESPIHRMKFKRYEDVKRFFKISDVDDDHDLIPAD
ncbi:hypothetical protein IFR05_016400 [Cadophora sp. M221]|nr:hypothetical protein IFR05_016400 [Cadophora sp. M221]